MGGVRCDAGWMQGCEGCGVWVDGMRRVLLMPAEVPDGKGSDGLMQGAEGCKMWRSGRRERRKKEGGRAGEGRSGEERVGTLRQEEE